MAITEIYVDPSIAADSGSGTSGDPYGDLEYAIEQETFDTTNGTRINIKAGTDEVLAASLDNALADTGTSVAWVPTGSAPLVFEGYAASAGDGGIGGISGGGSVAIIGGAYDYVTFKNLHLHNTGANDILTLDNFCVVTACEIDNTTGDGIVCDIGNLIEGCYIYNVGDRAINVTSDRSVISKNFISGTFDFEAIFSNGGVVIRNIITTSGAANGIKVRGSTFVCNNSVYSNAGSGSGITCTNGDLVMGIVNNLIEGFSASGGFGVEFPDTSGVQQYGGNSVFNCDTEFDTPGISVSASLGENETLSSSPFTDASNDDFSPVDTGSVKEGSLPESVGGGFV